MSRSGLTHRMGGFLQTWVWDGLHESFLFLCLARRLGDGGGLLASGSLVVLAAGLYLAPWVLFLPLSGQLADRLETSGWIRRIKRAGLGGSALAALAIMTGHPALLAASLAGLGLQAAFFRPVRSSLLPRILEHEQLVAGNSLLLAISSGTLLSGALGAWMLACREESVGACWMAAMVGLFLGFMGERAACRIPPLPAADPKAEVLWNPLRAARETVRRVARRRVLHLSMLGVAWFCLFGCVVLGLLYPWARQVLHASDDVVKVFLVLMGLGLTCGALLSERLSYERLEVGLVPFGTLGMTVFTCDLFLASRYFPTPSPSTPLLGSFQLLGMLAGIRILVDLLMLATFASFFVVPLLTAIQQHADRAWRSSALALSLGLNALFLGGGVVFLAALAWWDCRAGTAFAVLAVVNGLVSVYIYTLAPEFFLRLLAWFLAHGVYRLRTRGLEEIPREGPMLLACNHVSFVDWLVISATVKRPVRFVMWHAYAEIPILRYLLRDARVIPIASSRQNPELVEQAFREVAESLAQGDLVCLFPEGRITTDGNLSRFRPGIERMARDSGAPVLPLALRGFWGSLFSRRPGRLRRRLCRPLRSSVELWAGRPIPSQEVTAERLQNEVATVLRQQS
ncbi:MAG: 1-acyl-sn-glycerol-3-phosphate acyltransferase [Candidatus Xenobium sp.]|nr:glycerol acyltransferase [Burkholderiales bacterium]